MKTFLKITSIVCILLFLFATREYIDLRETLSLIWLLFIVGAPYGIPFYVIFAHKSDAKEGDNKDIVQGFCIPFVCSVYVVIVLIFLGEIFMPDIPGKTPFLIIVLASLSWTLVPIFTSTYLILRHFQYDFDAKLQIGVLRHLQYDFGAEFQKGIRMASLLTIVVQLVTIIFFTNLGKIVFFIDSDAVFLVGVFFELIGITGFMPEFLITMASMLLSFVSLLRSFD